MKRKRFIKIMQSKGLQHNEAAILAREIRKFFKYGVTYDFFSKGTVTMHDNKTYIIEFSKFQAIVHKTKKALPSTKHYCCFPPDDQREKIHFRRNNY